MLWDIFWPLMSSPSTQYQCHRLLVQEAGHKGKKWVDTAAPLSRKVLKRFQTSERQTWHLSDRRRSDCTESKLGLKRSWHWSQICDTNNETLVEELHHVKANSSVRLQNALAEQAETFPASSHPHRLPGHFPPPLSWVRRRTDSCLSCRWRTCTEKATLKGFFMAFLWENTTDRCWTVKRRAHYEEWPGGTSKVWTVQSSPVRLQLKTGIL